ncbi:MAG: S8 family serine peptidase [Chitinophagaceae bacterium]
MKLVLLPFFVFSIYTSFSQADIPKNWHTLDFEQDSFYGISLDKAYHFLQQKKLKPNRVIVAVLDSGCDTLQEDLKNILWHNPKEIPNNNIDDDGNGYVDDVYGWNFLGNKTGENLKNCSDEKTRIFYKFKQRFNGKKIDTNFLTKEELTDYKLWKMAANQLNITTNDEVEVALIDMTIKSLKKYDKILKNEMGVEEYTAQTLEKFEAKTTEAKQSKYGYLTTVRLLEIDTDEKNTSLIAQLEEYVEAKRKAITAKEKAPINYRDEIIKDDYANINDKYYGNPNVVGANPRHGTHVAGIIAAQRNNSLGIDGIADNVKMMILRVVPDGDEYDKDIALAIFYAVNNGAKVINMSFGKSISPEKYWIDSAVKYAASKDVLLVHAAGNDSKNVDSIPSFPTPQYQNENTIAPNFITVGASSDPKFSKGSIVADFSNFGKKTVNVFAPGVKIYSTVPGVNNYANLQGTSMAAPIVSGLAALLREYFTSLTATQVKNIIENTVIKPIEDNTVVVAIGNEINSKTSLKDLCTSGGIVNAYKAVELAFKIDSENKKPSMKKSITPTIQKSK